MEKRKLRGGKRGRKSKEKRGRRRKERGEGREKRKLGKDEPRKRQERRNRRQQREEWRKWSGSLSWRIGKQLESTAGVNLAESPQSTLPILWIRKLRHRENKGLTTVIQG